MGKSDEIVLVVGGVKLKAFSVHKWEDIVTDLLRLFPELGLKGAQQGFRYKGAFGREKVVNDEVSLERFFAHAVDENELEQNVTLVAGVPESVAGLATPAAHTAKPVATPPPARAPAPVAPAPKPIAVASIEFPCASAGDAVLQVRPVVIWGTDQITVSVFVCCSASSTHAVASGAPSHFLFSYSKRVFGSTVLDFALSSPTALKVHLKGDVIETTSSLAVDKWQHVVLSWTSRDGMLTLYIDGSKVFTSSKLKTGANLERGGAFLLGNTSEGNAENKHAFVGCMAEVSVWKKVLGGEVVRKMSAKPVLEGSEEGLCLYFNFKATSPTDSSLVMDVSADREGQLRGGASVIQKPVAIRDADGRSTSGGGAGGVGGGMGGSSGAGPAFESPVVRFEERSFGRLVTSPPVGVAGDQLTVAMWLCSLDTLQGGCVFSWVWRHGAGVHRVQVRDCANLEITIGGDSEASAVRSNVAVNDGRWHHVAISWKSKDGALLLHVDGAEQFAALGVSVGLRLDDVLEEKDGSKPGGAGMLVIGQCLGDLGARGVRDLHDAFFGLVAHFSLWDAALTAPVLRKLLASPLHGAEKNLSLYLNPEPAEWASRVVQDVAQGLKGIKLPWTVLGPVDLLKREALAAGLESLAALPLMDRQVRSKTVSIPDKSSARLALQPLPLGSGPGAGAELTVGVWVMVAADAQGKDRCIWSYSAGPRADASAKDGSGGMVVRDSSNLTICVDGAEVKSGCRLQPAVWYHVAVTWRAKDGACCLYVDCERKWAGKVGKDAAFLGEHASLWLGQEHSWSVLEKAREAGVPLAVLCDLLYCSNKEEAAAVLASEEAVDHVGKLRQLAGGALPPVKGGNAALAEAIHVWFCAASCVKGKGFVGQVAAPCVWRKALTRTDLMFVANGALLGNETGLVACLDMASFADNDRVVPDRFSEDVHGAVVSEGTVGAEVLLRAGVEWLPSLPPGSTPKLDGDLCVLHLGTGSTEHAECVLRQVALCSKKSSCSGAGPATAHELGADLSLSFWIRSVDTRPERVILAFATADAAKEVCVVHPGELQVQVAGNIVHTGVAVNDGHWHHVVIVWTGRELRGKDDKTQKGEILVYSNAVLMYRGPGITAGSAKISKSVGTFTLGGPEGFEGYLASVSVFDKHLDVKGVSALYASPRLRGSEKGLRVYYDFDFDGSPGGAKPVREIWNRARVEGYNSAAGLGGSAKLVLLRGDYKLVKSCKAPNAGADTLAALMARGGFGCKCLEFTDSKSEACAMLYPADVIPDRALTITLWVRSSDLKGHGTIVSYAAFLRQAFNLRVSHKAKGGAETSQLIRVEGSMMFSGLIEKLQKTFGEFVTIRHSLQGDVSVSSEAEFAAFCRLVCEKEEEEEVVVTPKTPAAAEREADGRKERQKAIAVTTAPFKGGAKVLTAKVDPKEEASMAEVEEICICNPENLEIAIKGQRCKGVVPINIHDGRWHHLALTWHSKGGQVNLYVDGNVRLQKTGVHADARLARSGCLAFGQSQSAVGKRFKKGTGFQGHITEVAVWNKALPLARVQRTQAAPLRGSEHGLLLLWKFEDDPFQGGSGGHILNSATDVSSCSTSLPLAKGEIRDKTALSWVDATLPGDGRVCGLGMGPDAADFISVDVRCSLLSEAILTNTSIKSLFFHVIVGEEGNDMEHALRHGCFAFAKTSYREASHRQILYVDELGHGFQRQALQRLVCNKSNDAEVLLLVQLCRETVTKVGDVLSEVVATGVIDLLEYLNAGRDEVDHELRLWPPGQKATKGDPEAVVSVGLQAVAALRALVKSKDPKPAHATSAMEAVPKLERVKSNFSRSDSSMASAAAAAAAALSRAQSRGISAQTPPESTNPTLGIGSEENALRRDESLSSVAIAGPLGGNDGASPAPNTASVSASAASSVPAPLAATAKKEKTSKDDAMDLPERIVFKCKKSGLPEFRLEMDFELTWIEAQKVLAEKLGEGQCIEFTDQKTRQPCRITQPNTWEKLRMQLEDDFDHDSGDAVLSVKVVPLATVKEGSVGNAPETKANRSKGTDPSDNPDVYDFHLDCSQLGPGWWQGKGSVTETVDPEILWDDFRVLITTKFGAAVLISYVDSTGKTVPLHTKDDFDAACDQIEDEWDDAEGDGSLQCILSPPEGGMPFVQHQGEELLRLPVGDERQRVQVQARKVAARMRAGLPAVSAAILGKEKAAGAKARGKGSGKVLGMTSEQVLKAVYSCKVLEGEQVLQALERLVLDDDMLLALDTSLSANNTEGSKEQNADRLLDWTSFLERFRLATVHEARVMDELQDAVLRVAMKGVYQHQQALSQALAGDRGNSEWGKCDRLLREECCLSDNQAQCLSAWARSRNAEREIDGRPPVPDVKVLADEAQLVDVGSLMVDGLMEEAVLCILRQRDNVEAALAKLPRLKADSGNSDECGNGVELCAAASAVSEAAGLGLAVARRLLLRSATIVRKVVAAQTEGSDGTNRENVARREVEDDKEIILDEVLVDGWLEKLWVLHAGEIDTLERARDARRQSIRRALVCQKSALVKAIRECADQKSDELIKADTRGGTAAGHGKEPKKRGISGIKDAIVTACQSEGVVCSVQDAQAVCDEVLPVAGRRDVAGFVEGLQLVDVVRGSLDSCCTDVCGKISAFLEACNRATTNEHRAHALLLPAQIVQALLAVGVSIRNADVIAQECAQHSCERVDCRDIVCGRLLVLSEHERLRLATPMVHQQQKTLTARLKFLDRKATVLAALANKDSLGRGFVDASQVLSVLQDTLQLPVEQCQALIDAAAGPGRAGAGDNASMRKIDYMLLNEFRIVLARPAAAAFCSKGCSGCATVAERFICRQGSVMQALHDASSRWRNSLPEAANVKHWGTGLLPYAEFEAVLRAELCGVGVARGEWDTRHVRSLALAQGRLVVDASDVGVRSAAGSTSGAEDGEQAPGYACHLVRVEGLSERFAVLESADAAALSRLASFPHQRALGFAHAAYMRLRITPGDFIINAPKDWDTLRGANSAAALLIALCSNGESQGPSDEEVPLPLGDLPALTHIWGAGMSVEEMIGSLVPVYCHMLPASAPAMTKVPKKSTKKRADPAPQATGFGTGARALGANAQASPGGLTRGQQVFRKLLAGRRPGVMQILQAMGAMTPTCVPSPLNDGTKKLNVGDSTHMLANVDPSFVRYLQLSFVEATGVPGPGERYLAKNRMLKVCLFDATMMKFVGKPLMLELSMPKDDKPQNTLSWLPAKAAPKIFVSADLKAHARMYLYLELGQLSQRRSDTAGNEILDVSCGHATMLLADVPNGSSGKKELSVSGGTPFMPKHIAKDQLTGAKSSGLLARLKGATTKSMLTIKLEKVDTNILEMVKNKRLPPNTLCVSDVALPLAHFQSLTAESRARSVSPQKSRGGTLSASAAIPVLEDLFTKAQVQNDPVLGLFPKVRDSPQILTHFSAAWSHRYGRLSTRDKANNQVLQKLLRECTLIVWPLMKMGALREKSAKEAAAQEEAVAKYMQAAKNTKSLSEMRTVIAAAASEHQPFKIEELID